MGSATSKIDTYIRLEGMRFDQLLGSDTAIIASSRKTRIARVSKVYVCVADGYRLQLTSKSE